jgi:hypothetical protein
VLLVTGVLLSVIGILASLVVMRAARVTLGLGAHSIQSIQHRQRSDALAGRSYGRDKYIHSSISLGTGPLGRVYT